MAKTLIIKGADFSHNYIEQVVFSEKPCTGIILNSASESLPNTSDTVTLVATVTPSDTTDPVIWISSDTDIAEVTNGVVSAVGIGTATITAQCGDFSASCTVTCGGVVNFKYSVGAWMGVNNNADFVKVSNTAATDAFSVGLADGGYHATYNETADGWLYPIMIPKNAVTLKCRCLTQYYGVQTVFFLDSKAESTFYEDTAKYIQQVSGIPSWGDKTYNGQACFGNDIELPSGNYDSAVILLKQRGSVAVRELDAQSTHIWFETE